MTPPGPRSPVDSHNAFLATRSRHSRGIAGRRMYRPDGSRFAYFFNVRSGRTARTARIWRVQIARNVASIKLGPARQNMIAASPMTPKAVETRAIFRHPETYRQPL